ncbi:hypothetical protein GCM10009525_76990 [Streptosporangium amethystogenes subsp. fukuiense]
MWGEMGLILNPVGSTYAACEPLPPDGFAGSRYLALPARIPQRKLATGSCPSDPLLGPRAWPFEAVPSGSARAGTPPQVSEAGRR